MTDNLQKEAQEYQAQRGRVRTDDDMKNAYLAGRKKTIEENERLRELIEKAHKDGYPDHVTEKFKEDMWQQFKQDNGL